MDTTKKFSTLETWEEWHTAFQAATYAHEVIGLCNLFEPRRFKNGSGDPDYAWVPVFLSLAKGGYRIEARYSDSRTMAFMKKHGSIHERICALVHGALEDLAHECMGRMSCYDPGRSMYTSDDKLRSWAAVDRLMVEHVINDDLRPEWGHKARQSLLCALIRYLPNWGKGAGEPYQQMNTDMREQLVVLAVGGGYYEVLLHVWPTAEEMKLLENGSKHPPFYTDGWFPPHLVRVADIPPRDILRAVWRTKREEMKEQENGGRQVSQRKRQ